MSSLVVFNEMNCLLHLSLSQHNAYEFFCSHSLVQPLKDKGKGIINQFILNTTNRLPILLIIPHKKRFLGLLSHCFSYMINETYINIYI